MGAACLLAAALAACSAVRLVYNQGAQWAYWWLDGYADFTDDQEPRVREALDRWFAWHRRTQLADYAALLDQARAQVQQDITPAQVCGWWDPLLQRRDEALNAALPAITAIATTLRPEQLTHIERQMEKTQRELRDDYLQDDAGDRHRAAVKRTLDRVEMLYGRLDRPQREAVGRLVAQSPWKPEHWVAQREHRAADMLATLRALARPGIDAVQAQALVRAWATRVSQRAEADEASQRYQQEVDAYNCRVGAEIHNLTTTAQRRTAVEKLLGWRQDLMNLAGSGNSR